MILVYDIWMILVYDIWMDGWAEVRRAEGFINLCFQQVTG